MNKFKNRLVSLNLPSIWILTFFFTATMALFFQLVALPLWLSEIHAGNGLLVGGDWIGFSRIASDLAQTMAREGWSSWELRPERQSPAGIAAFFYFLFGPNPWTLVPMNAAIHATTAVLMVCIMKIFFSDTRLALLCTLPFILFPTSLMWYSQIHKDGVFFLGITLNLYGWILLSCIKTWEGISSKTFLPVLCIFIGCFVIWVMRPYGVQMMQGIGCIFAIILVPYFITQALRRKFLFRQAFFAIFIIVSLPILIDIFNPKDKGGGIELVTQEMLAVDQGVIFPHNYTDAGIGDDVKVEDKTISTKSTKPNYQFLVKAQNTKKELEWEYTDWLHPSLDNLFLTISIVRSGYASTIGGSSVDSNVRLRSAPEFLYYLPRAIQIGFTMPIPSFWHGQDINGKSAILKSVAMVEMLLVYFSLFFLGYALFRWNRKIEIWLIFIFCVIFILLYTYITPNIGSLHRTRHGFLMVLLALGIAGGINFWQRKFNTLLRVSIKENGH